jgi:tetratricopeptide (TPR) repeat protein
MNIARNLLALVQVSLIAVSCANAAPNSEGKAKQQLASDSAALAKAPTAKNYGVRAGTYIDLNMYKEALADLDQAIKLDAKSPLYHGTRAAVLTKLKRYKDAILECNTAIKLSKHGDGDYISALETRSSAYLSAGDNKNAKADDAELKRLGVPE